MAARARSRSPTGERELKEGEWICSGCKGHNFSRRTDCFQCKMTKTASSRADKGLKTKLGDWDCANCQGFNFAYRTDCFKCNEPKMENTGQNMDQDYGVRSNPNNDWWCVECNINNYPHKTACFRCKRSKMDCIDNPGARRGGQGSRRGGGGGGRHEMFDQRGRGDMYEDRSDWVCNGCGVHNGPKRQHCYKCERSRQAKPNNWDNREYDLRQDMGSKRQQSGREGDWNCGSCSFLNYATRDACYKCLEPKQRGKDGDDNFAVTFEVDRQDPGPSNLNKMMLNHSISAAAPSVANRLGRKHNGPLMPTPGTRRPRINSGSEDPHLKRQRRNSFEGAPHGLSQGPPIRTAFYEEPPRRDMGPGPRGRDMGPRDMGHRDMGPRDMGPRDMGPRDMGHRAEDRRPPPRADGPTDYVCQECGTHNNATRSTCKKCNRSNPTLTRRGSVPEPVQRVVADWQCRDCECSNFSRRSSCFKCGQSRITCELRQLVRVPKRMPVVETEADGWFCDECDNCNDPVNFKCRRCGAYRAGDETTGGAGGGPPPQQFIHEDLPFHPPHRGNFHNDPPRNYSPPRQVFHHEPARGPPHNHAPVKRGGVRPGLVEPIEGMLSGDWMCKGCKINNFSKRKECFKCKKPKADCEVKVDKHGKAIGPNDWLCDGCGENNFSRRTSCFKCKAPKVKEDDVTAIEA